MSGIINKHITGSTETNYYLYTCIAKYTQTYSLNTDHLYGELCCTQHN